VRCSTASAIVQSVAMAVCAWTRVTVCAQTAVWSLFSTLSLSLFGPEPVLCPGEGGSTHRLRGSLGSPPSSRLIW
jgi:hypothetical protein